MLMKKLNGDMRDFTPLTLASCIILMAGVFGTQDLGVGWLLFCVGQYILVQVFVIFWDMWHRREGR